MIYVRHRNGWAADSADRPQPPRVFEPLKPDHPLVIEGVDGGCPACQMMFLAGDRTVLVPLGPGDDKEAQEKAKAGRFYNAVAVAVHAACAGIEP
jgi:hypothetical protein